ncbi:MAG: hypothetical protein K2X48_01830 [Chitinophagaceae bacterium]|nr:hypothetical protein [Chitinophagaceae bacterium]
MAQFQKGNKVLGFGLGFNSFSNEETANNFTQKRNGTGFNLSTELGFATGANRLNGFFVSGGFNRTRFENPAQAGSKFKEDSYNAGAGFFTRVYKPIGKSFFVFGDGRAGFNYSEQRVGATTFNNQKNYSVAAAIYPGIAYKWNQKFLLELRLADLLSLNYSHVRTKNGVNNAKSTSNNFGLNSSLGVGYLQNFGIGARWILGSNKKS